MMMMMMMIRRFIHSTLSLSNVCERPAWSGAEAMTIKTDQIQGV